MLMKTQHVIEISNDRVEPRVPRNSLKQSALKNPPGAGGKNRETTFSGGYP
jgi:hypothetical protein